MKKFLKFSGIQANQSDNHSVMTMVCQANEIFQIAEIDRIRRSEKGEIFGFQRPKILNHINEIRDYLNQENAVLPNSVVLAFTKDVSIVKTKNEKIDIEIDITPQDYMRNEDPQLNKAIEEVLVQLEGNPPKLPDFGNKPDLSFSGSLPS